MGREDSHSRACSSRDSNLHSKHSRSCSSSASFASPSPRPSIIQRNLRHLSASDLLLFAKQLKHPGITTLRFYISLADHQTPVSRRLRDDQSATDNLSAFTRALANAVEGWMQSLELGMCLGASDINSLYPAIRYSKKLRHLSFMNSGLGDDMLQILASALENCLPLRILNLSGCALTDASSCAIAAIVKGEGLPKCRGLSSSSADHRAPKYGQQWRQNVILMGKWPPPTPAPVRVCKSRDSHDRPTHVTGLAALDVSCNSFSDALSQELCPVLYKKPALRALNLRCNQMTRLGAKLVLDVMKEVNVLRVVDMRCNKDEGLLGVLENGEHYTTFSTFQAPFWMDAKSLDPVICKPKRLVPEKISRLAALSRPKISSQQVGRHIRDRAGSHKKCTGPPKANNCSRAVLCSSGTPEWASNSQKRHARTPRSTWPEKTTNFSDHTNNSFRETVVSWSPEFAVIEPTREHNNDFRRSQSAGGFHNHQDNDRYRNHTADVADGSRRCRGGGRSDHSINRCHHRCKLRNDHVQEQHKCCNVAARAVQVKRTSYTPPVTQTLPPLPDDKKELVEWNNFVNQMTKTLLNLKDVIAHLMDPTEGAIKEVAQQAQQAASKLHQMPSSFFRSGMLRQLDRSCRVLNSHVASLAKRRRESLVRHLNTENEAPALICDEAATMKEGPEQQATIDYQDTAENQKAPSRPVREIERPSTNPSTVVKHLALQDQLIGHPKLPPLSISKGTNIP